MDDDEDSDDDAAAKPNAPPPGGPGSAVPTLNAGAGSSSPAKPLVMNTTLSNLSIGFDTKRDTGKSRTTTANGLLSVTTSNLTGAAPAPGSMTDRAAVAATNAAAASASTIDPNTGQPASTTPPSPPPTVTITGFAAGSAGSGSSNPLLAAVSNGDTIRPVATSKAGDHERQPSSASPGKIEYAVAPVVPAQPLSPAARASSHSITSAAAIANHNKALIRLMALDEVSVLCERIRRQLVDVDPTLVCDTVCDAHRLAHWLARVLMHEWCVGVLVLLVS